MPIFPNEPVEIAEPLICPSSVIVKYLCKESPLFVLNLKSPFKVPPSFKTCEVIVAVVVDEPYPATAELDLYYH